MEITDDKLIKIALITSLIGIIGLIIFTPTIEVKQVDINQINRGMIDEEVKRTWNLPKEWELVAQMPFGMPLSAPGKKSMKPLEERVKVFR